MRTPNLLSTLFLCALVPSLWGCGKLAAELNNLNLDGNWQLPCVTSGSTSTSALFKISGDQVQTTTQKFSGPNCTGLSSTDTQAGTFKQGQASDVAPGARELDFNMTHLARRYERDDAADGANLDSSNLNCQFHGWHRGDDRALTRECTLPDSPAQTPYTVIWLDGNKLYLGSSSGGPVGMSPEARHRTLSKTPFVKS